MLRQVAFHLVPLVECGLDTAKGVLQIMVAGSPCQLIKTGTNRLVSLARQAAFGVQCPGNVGDDILYCRRPLTRRRQDIVVVFGSHQVAD